MASSSGSGGYTHDGHRAEAERLLNISQKLLIARDLYGTKTFAIRVRDSDPTFDPAHQMVAVPWIRPLDRGDQIDTLCSNQMMLWIFYCTWYSARKEDEKHEQVSVADVPCVACKQLLIRSVVLNCGHVYCRTCIHPDDGLLKCQVCSVVNPSGIPKTCRELDQFLEEKFPV